MGWPQFMPSSFRAFAVDWNNDGHHDIWNTPADAMASVASYLSLHGWKDGGSATAPVNVSGSRIEELIADKFNLHYTVGELIDMGVAPLEQLEQELVARGLDQNGPQGAHNKREQLQNLYQQLLASGRPLQIRTFHSWFAALLSTAPLALLQERGLPTHYELLEDDAPAKAAVWRPFLAAVEQDASLRADYAAVVAAHGRSQTHKALEAALDKRVEFALADEAGIVAASVPAFGQQVPALAGHDSPAQALAGEAEA